jgi:hypothetical protein
VFACGTDLSHAISNVSHETLCPSGLDKACPQNQYCYAGIPSNQELREVQLQAEAVMIQAGINARHEGFDQQVEERFVCGITWEDAVASACRSSPSWPASSSQGPIQCQSGLSTQCPYHMECFASVSCPASSQDIMRIDQEISVKNYEMTQNLSSVVDNEPSSSWYEQVSDYSNRLDSLLSFGSC